MISFDYGCKCYTRKVGYEYNEMKGIIFRSFIEFAEKKYGLAFVDEMLNSLALASNGVYTNVGKYPYTELIAFFNYISQNKDIKSNVLAEEFGVVFFKSIINSNSFLNTTYNNSFECLCHIEQDINRQVKKLYIDAELPTLSAVSSADGQSLTIHYISSRPFTHLWYGIIRGCVNYFKEDVTIEMTDRSAPPEYKALFTLRRQ